MALKPCRECQKQVSTLAATCPHCGAPVAVPAARPRRKLTRSKVFWIPVVLLFAASTAMVIVTNLPQEATSTVDRTPGITRLGADRAAKLWADLPETPGMQRWSCDGDLCYVMFDPAAWSQMGYDLKRSFTTAMGIALAYGKRARWTEIRDMMTGKELAQYTTASDGVKIE